MKKPYIKLLGLVIVALTIGLIFTSLQSSKKYKFVRTAEEQHEELTTSKHYIDPNVAWEIISKKDESYAFIDIRNPRDYDNFHVESAINIPIQQALDDTYKSYFQNSKKKILYSDESIKADQIRVLLTQYGYENLFVLQGGANYWKDNMLSSDVFKSKAAFDDEKLKFDPEKLKASK